MMMVAGGVGSAGTLAGGYALKNLSSGSNSQGSGGGGNNDNLFKKPWIRFKICPVIAMDSLLLVWPYSLISLNSLT